MECEQYKYKRIDCGAFEKLIYMPCTYVMTSLAWTVDGPPGASNWNKSAYQTLCKAKALRPKEQIRDYQPGQIKVFVQFKFKTQKEYHYCKIDTFPGLEIKSYCYYLGSYAFNWLYPYGGVPTASKQYPKLTTIPKPIIGEGDKFTLPKEDIENAVRLMKDGRPQLALVDYITQFGPEQIAKIYSPAEQYIIREWKNRWNQYEMAQYACVEKYENLGRPARIIATGAEGEVVDIYHRQAMEKFLIYKIYKSRFEVWHVTKKEFQYLD